MPNKQKPQKQFTHEDIEEMQKKVNKDLQKPQRDNKNHIPHSFDETMSWINNPTPDAKK